MPDSQTVRNCIPLSKKQAIKDDFTLFVATADVPLDWVRWHQEAEASLLLTYDTQAQVDFLVGAATGETTLSNEGLSGRIHAAPCFGGSHYGVTFRDFKKLDKNSEFWKDYAKVQKSLPRPTTEEAIYRSRNQCYPVFKGWKPSKSLETAEDTCKILYNYCFQNLGHRAGGLILFAGGTGTGKTTFLNGVLRIFLKDAFFELAKKRRPHIVAVGDPIETFFYDEQESKSLEKIVGIQKALHQYRPFDFTARSLGKERQHDTPSVAAALKDALRETPSAVIVSELRDDDDFRAALKFAGTGHLIFATSHATTLAEAIGRLLDVSGATDAAGRAEVANRLLAVVHHTVIAGPPRVIGYKLKPTALNVPSLWIGGSEGRRNLIADGLVSLTAAASEDGTLPSGVLGRYGMTLQLEKEGKSETEPLWKTEVGHRAKQVRTPLYTHFRKEALKLDLQNR
jgi:hypothetical protein